MYATSVYKYFRPFFLLCCFFGQFSSVKILSQTSEELEFKLLSIPVLVFIVGKIFGVYNLKYVLYEKLKDNSFLLIHHTLTVGLNIIVMGCLTACSKNVIKSLQEIDKTRRNINLLPHNCIPKESSVLFPAVLAVFLLGFVLGFGVIHVYNNVTDEHLVGGYVYFVFLSFFPFKSFLIVGAVFYSASMSVQDIVESLRQYKRFNCKPDENLNIYCQLLMVQSEFMRRTNKFMTSYHIITLGYRVFNILNVLFYRIHSTRSYVASSVADFAAWNACMMYFLCGVHSSAVQVSYIVRSEGTERNNYFFVKTINMSFNFTWFNSRTCYSLLPALIVFKFNSS